MFSFKRYNNQTSRKQDRSLSKIYINLTIGNIMSELERFAFEEKGEVYEVIIDEPTTSEDESPFDEERDVRSDATNRMQQARLLIRNYAMYAVTAFKDFGAAEVEEVTLKFSIKMGGKTGIPYIAEGSAESNLEIEVKCKFPKSDPSEKS